MKNLLAIFAHPDDEGAMAGTLARYAKQGYKVMLICATKGEAGEISEPTLATSETLGEVRTAELREACDILGISELHFLGYRDSGMANTPANEDPRALVQAHPEEAIERLVKLMRQLKPDVVVTFEPFGWYGHPDHQAVSRLVTAAYERVANSGQPWQPQKLFYSVMPFSKFQTVFEHAQVIGLVKADDNGFGEMPLDLLQETEAQVTHILNVQHLFEIRQKAMWVHRTQFGEENWFRNLPEELTRHVWSDEHFIQVYPAPADEPRRIQTDGLFE